jgi:hypothetical protein
MTIPSDILAADAAGRIPSNVSLEYLAESRDKSAIVGIIFMICFTGLLMIVRLYARAFIVKKIGLDDALAILTFVCSSTLHPQICTRPHYCIRLLLCMSSHQRPFIKTTMIPQNLTLPSFRSST